ncbi:proto-oncogene tyrosine-protein kinase ROS-like protein, partial [Leptotrombidium deliense]
MVNVISTKDTHNSNINDAMHYMFTGLKPGTIYNVEVSCRNEVSKGPKMVRQIETPRCLFTDSSDQDTEEAYLILASEKNVFKQSHDIMQLPETMFRLTDYSAFDNITSIAIHVSLKFVFVSDTSGTIRRICFRESRNFQVKTIYKPSKKINSNHIYLSIDWLNYKLYFNEEISISKIDLNGNNKYDVITNFVHMITELHIDPYNAYLYYAYEDNMEVGIYRVDMNLIKSKTVRFHESRLIYKDTAVTVLTVDYANYRIYLPKSNSILS